MKWMPISDAPKDGTVVLLTDRFPHRTAVAGYYDKEEAEYPWRFLDGSPELNGWRDDNTGPTHWMPLPEPPQEKADESK